MSCIRALPCAAVAALVGSSASGGLMYATAVEHFDQGLTNGGNAVSAARSDASKALGAPQDNDTENFVALGFGGEIILSFGASFTDDTAIVWETTYGNASNYPETAQLFVGAGASWDTADWYFVADLPNDEDGQMIPLAGVGGATDTFQFVRIVDTTNGQLHNSSADGYDVDAVGVVPTPGTTVLAMAGVGLVARRRR